MKIVIAFAGSVTKDAAICNRKGIDAFFPITDELLLELSEDGFGLEWWFSDI